MSFLQHNEIYSKANAIKQARTCYDHMAGVLGVAVTQSLMDRNILKLDGKKFKVTQLGHDWFASLGIDVEAERAKRRKFAYACIDWSERVPHLAGALGAALCREFVSRNWIRRNKSNRAVEITPKGALALREHFGLNL